MTPRPNIDSGSVYPAFFGGGVKSNEWEDVGDLQNASAVVRDDVLFVNSTLWNSTGSSGVGASISQQLSNGSTVSASLGLGSIRLTSPSIPSIAEEYGSASGNSFLASTLEGFRRSLLDCPQNGYDAVSSGRMGFMAERLTYMPNATNDSTVMLTNSSTVASEELAFDNLYPAVVECFFVIICGYIAGKCNFISPFEAKGLNTFVGTFALPALIFRSMAELNFSSVNWTFLFAISMSKAAVFLLVAVVTILVDRPMDFGKSGLFAIFCTQSNDFALGYPIIASLYRNSHPDFPSYLYLVAPISLVFLNPIGFVLMEFQRRRDQQRRGEVGSFKQSTGSLASQIFTGVALNPVVLMTALGIVGNFVFNHCLPPILAGILKVLSSAYSATALFVLGLRLVGTLHRLRGAALVVPSILIMTKGLVLPLITREIVDNLRPGADLNETTAYSNYGFLYGTFPTAPTVFVYAAQYNIEVDMIASAMVIGTFLSALLMFVSARMVTLTNVLPQDYMAELNGFLFNISVFGALACAAVVVIFCLTRKWRKMPHFVTLCLAASQLTACVGVLMWGFIDNEHTWKLYLQFFVFAWGVFSSRVWTALLAVTLVLVRVRPLADNMKLRKYFPIIGWLVPGIIVACLLLVVAMDSNRVEKSDPNFQYGSAQAIVAVLVLASSFLVTVFCLILQQRLRRKSSPVAGLSPHWYKELPSSSFAHSCSSSSTCSSSDLSDSFADMQIIQHPNQERRLMASTSFAGNYVGRTGNQAPEISSPGSTPRGIDGCLESPVRSSLQNQLLAFDRQDDEKNSILYCPTDELNPPVPEMKSKRRTNISRATSYLSNDESCTSAHSSPQSSPKLRLSALSIAEEVVPNKKISTGSFGSNFTTPEEEFSFAKAYGGFTDHQDLMKRSAAAATPMEPEETSIVRDRDDEYQILRHVVLLLILSTSMLVGLSLCLWSLVVEGTTGIYIELVFLDVALNFGQGFFVFAIFGLDQKLVVAPLLKRWRQCYHGTSEVKPPPPEKLSGETLYVCQQFVSYHMDKCVRDIVRDRRFRNKVYKQAFCGNELVDWLLIVGLAPDRAHATKYGKHLVTGRVVRHFDREHHFHDQPLFYTFCVFDEAQDEILVGEHSFVGPAKGIANHAFAVEAADMEDQRSK